MEIGGYPLAEVRGCSLWWRLLLQSTSSRCTGFSSSCSQALGRRKRVILIPPISIEAGHKLPRGEEGSLQPVYQRVEVVPSDCLLGEPWRLRPVGQSFLQVGWLPQWYLFAGIGPQYPPLDNLGFYGRRWYPAREQWGPLYVSVKKNATCHMSKQKVVLSWTQHITATRTAPVVSPQGNLGWKQLAHRQAPSGCSHPQWSPWRDSGWCTRS